MDSIIFEIKDLYSYDQLTYELKEIYMAHIPMNALNVLLFHQNSTEGDPTQFLVLAN